MFPCLFFSETTNVGQVSWEHLGFTDPDLGNAKDYLAYGSGSMERVSLGDNLVIRDLAEDMFWLTHMAPVWTLGNTEVALLGELYKDIPISNDRIALLRFLDNESLKLILKVVTFLFLQADLKQLTLNFGREARENSYKYSLLFLRAPWSPMQFSASANLLRTSAL